MPIGINFWYVALQEVTISTIFLYFVLFIILKDEDFGADTKKIWQAMAQQTILLDPMSPTKFKKQGNRYYEASR